MNSLDILYLALAFSAITIAIFLNLVLYRVSQTLVEARKIIENLHSYTSLPIAAKDKVKLTALRVVNKVLSFIPHKRTNTK